MKEIFFNSCCIVSFSTSNFITGQKRLKQSLIANGYTGDFLFFDDSNKKIPLQKDVPYGFKPFVLNIAVQKGYKYILWLDSSIICIRNPKKIFSIIKKEGTFVWSPYTAKMGEWCSDIALNSFNLQRETSFQIDELCGAIYGFNTENPDAISLFNEWNAYANDKKTFLGIPKNIDYKESFTNKTLLVSKDERVKGHRHDQTALSFLAYKYKIPLHYLEVKDICMTDLLNNNHIYSKAIGFDTILVLNRDIKSSVYYDTYNKYGNSKGLKKLLFIILSLIDTMRRRIFYIKKKG